MRILSAFAALFTLAIGCSGVDSPANVLPCQALVTVSVGSGTAPTFSWTPQCMAVEVIVSSTTGFVTYWLVTGAANSNSLQPPVRYGHPPNPASLGTPNLVAGNPYSVHVLRATGDSAAPFEAIGSADFVP